MAERNSGLALKRVAVAVLAALGLIATLTFCGSADPDPSTARFSATEGKPLGDLVMTTLEGDVIRLSSYKGNPVLMNFWASWCKPCREEFSLLQSAIQSHGVVVVGVVFEDTDARAAAFKKKMSATWPMVKDPSGVIARGFRVTRPPGIPQTVFIDSKGVYRTKILGQMSAKLLEETIAGLPD